MPVSLDELWSQIQSSASNAPADMSKDIKNVDTSGGHGYDFDFNNVVQLFPGEDVHNVLTKTTREGGVDEHTRFQAAGKAIGHFLRMVREGRYDLTGAWQASKDWNQASLVPPWSEERLRVDFDRLVREDIEDKGPFVPVVPAIPINAGEWRVTDWRADRFKGEAPARQWLVEGLVPMGTAGTFAAVGDAGKSMMALQLALFTTSYPDPVPEPDTSSPRFFGQRVVARGPAVILTAEDDANEIHRRLNALDPTYARAGRPLYVVPMVSTGGARAVLMDGFNGPAPTPFWSDLREQLVRIPNLRLVVLDPLSSFVAADVNDNMVGSVLMSMLAELAAATGAAVMMVHHVGKGASPTDLKDARAAVRGASSLVDNGRWTLVIWEAEREDAEHVLTTIGDGKRATQAGLVYYGGLAKGNAGGSVKVLRTLARAPSGVLQDVTDAVRAGTPRASEIDGIVHAILLAEYDANERFSFTMSRSGVDKLIPRFMTAGCKLQLKDIWPACQRLVGKKLIVPGGKDGHYQPVREASG